MIISLIRSAKRSGRGRIDLRAHVTALWAQKTVGAPWLGPPERNSNFGENRACLFSVRQPMLCAVIFSHLMSAKRRWDTWEPRVPGQVLIKCPPPALNSWTAEGAASLLDAKVHVLCTFARHPHHRLPSTAQIVAFATVEEIRTVSRVVTDHLSAVGRITVDYELADLLLCSTLWSATIISRWSIRARGRKNKCDPRRRCHLAVANQIICYFQPVSTFKMRSQFWKLLKIKPIKWILGNSNFKSYHDESWIEKSFVVLAVCYLTTLDSEATNNITIPIYHCEWDSSM